MPEGPAKKAKPRQGVLERLPPSLPQTSGRGKGVLQMQEPPAREGSQVLLDEEACRSATATAPCGQGGHVLTRVLVRLSIHRMCSKAKEGISVQRRSMAGPSGCFLSCKAQCLTGAPWLFLTCRERAWISFVPARSAQSNSFLPGSLGECLEREGPHRAPGWDAAEL